MGAPTVPYKILAKGYQITGDTQNGYKAVVPYLVEWKYAFTFADDIFGLTVAGKVGPITWFMPYRFPYANANLYAQSFTIDPCGSNGDPIFTAGLRPGDYFSHAIIKVSFETPKAIQSGGDDPHRLHQLDPNNPITMCEQTVQVAGKMETRDPGCYQFASGTVVTAQVGVLVPECKIILSFPRVPYLPWTLVRPYIGSVNLNPFLDVNKGEMLLEGMDSRIVQTNTGITQQVELHFAWSSLGDWNLMPQSDGSMALVHRNGAANTDANRIYPYKDHAQIFASIAYASV